MKTKKLSLYTKIFSILSGLMMLSTACQVVVPTNSVTDVPASDVKSPTMEAVNTPVSTEGLQLNVNLGDLSQSMSEKIIPAVSPEESHPYWEILPEHYVYTLQGYPVSNHILEAQIFVYPVKDLAQFNEGADKIAKDLAVLLDEQQVGDYIPFMPLLNASQVLHAQVEFIDFADGKGLRFLTQFDQAAIPINNYELFYTFQGLTNDGEYYVSAILPVSHPELPNDSTVFSQQAEEMKDFPAYLENTTKWLDQQSFDSFTPNLSNLDELIQSIDIN